MNDKTLRNISPKVPQILVPHHSVATLVAYRYDIITPVQLKNLIPLKPGLGRSENGF